MRWRAVVHPVNPLPGALTNNYDGLPRRVNSREMTKKSGLELDLDEPWIVWLSRLAMWIGF